ncbi:uncharacterized protein LOC135072958 [Ostrinia nubilalis]|uniref:uncharacterized protein LOC135072958 n=1 Tax=Ostrinia nubilalis TaxID=29057 RepID=UPI0030824121
MKKRNKSEASLLSTRSDMQMKEEIYVPPMDVFIVKVLSLQVTDDIPKHYAIKVTFFDQLLLTGIVKTVSAKSKAGRRILAKGTMNYDPSDYEKMCLFADCPLVVNIQPLKSIETNMSTQGISPRLSTESNRSSSTVKPIVDISCCNVDILPVFIDKDRMVVQKRMEPMIKPPILQTKSWDNLPLLTLELSVDRNELNEHHHKVLKKANYMKVTLLSAYNVQIPFDEEYIYTAASKTPLHNETNTGLVTFNQGYRVPNRFNPMSFYPKWESLRVGDDVFTRGDEKFVCNLETVHNTENIDLNYYMSKKLKDYTIVWGSFHRTLMLEHSDAWLGEHLGRYCWPFEVHVYGEQNGLSFMAFLNLFHLLYPGENCVRMAVPLHWVNPQVMLEKCGCELLLTPNDNLASTTGSTPKAKLPGDSVPTSTSTEMGISLRPTGADENCAFIVVEVKLARPLKKAVIPTPITSAEINDMLQEMELGPVKRENTGRGQLDREWQSTVRAAESSLRKVPHYGMTEFCAFNRQLSETRTRVELMTSCCLDAAIYVNNNFVVQEFLRSDDTFEEMLMMSHACLTRIACSTLVGNIHRQDIDPTLKAARHARQMQDTSHALELYLQLVVQKPRSPNSWRELSTCLRDVDSDWANVCINKSIVLDPRHPLTLVSKGSILFEDDPEAAEPFFVALLALYPFWLTGWVIVNAYYLKRELFHMADQVMEYQRKSHAEGLVEDIGIPRAWEYELGDWWDNTPLLPGTNPYFEAADLLLRLRAFGLAEVCLSRAIAEAGESAASLHMVALSCRLRGSTDDALCHLQLAIEKFGDISYLRGLQAECLHKNKDITAAMASFEKAGNCLSGYSILLSMPCWETQRGRSLLLDLIRRQPSAYAWVALAEDWLQRAALGEAGDADVTDEQTAAKTCAAACAVQALKCDRQAGRAWALLSRLVVPSARRLHCRNMAETCGFMFNDDRVETSAESQQSLCHRLGRALRECRCNMCEYLKF